MNDSIPTTLTSTELTRSAESHAKSDVPEQEPTQPEVNLEPTNDGRTIGETTGDAEQEELGRNRQTESLPTSRPNLIKVNRLQCPAVTQVVAKVRFDMETREAGSVERLWPISPPDAIDFEEVTTNGGGRHRRHKDHHNENFFKIRKNPKPQNKNIFSNPSFESIWLLPDKEPNLSTWTVLLDANESFAAFGTNATDTLNFPLSDTIEWVDEISNHSTSRFSSNSKQVMTKNTATDPLSIINSRPAMQRSLAKRRIEPLESDDSELGDDEPLEEELEDLEQTISTTSTSLPALVTSGSTSGQREHLFSLVSAKSQIDQEEELVYLAQLMPNERINQRSTVRSGLHV